MGFRQIANQLEKLAQDIREGKVEVVHYNRSAGTIRYASVQDRNATLIPSGKRHLSIVFLDREEREKNLIQAAKNGLVQFEIESPETMK